MTSEPEPVPTAAGQSETEQHRYLWPRTIDKMPPDQQLVEYARTAHSLYNRNKILARSRRKWQAKAEAYEEALSAIEELAKNARIIL